MRNYLSRIRKIKKQFAISEEEHFVAAPNGTHHRVFLSDSYVIRFRDDNPELLLREAQFLKQLDHPKIPEVLWSGKVNQIAAMVENRLPGKTMNVVWKTLPEIDQATIITQIVEFLQYQRTQTKEHVYSVSTGKKYKKFLDYLTDGMKQKIAGIKKLLVSKNSNKRME